VPAWELRPLGNTPLRVRPLGLGGAWLGHTPSGVDVGLGVDTVLAALAEGLNAVDTSAAYQGGQSERTIGLAIDAWRRSGGRREDLILSTKTGSRTTPHDYSGDATRRSVEISLEALRTDYLDVVFVHDPAELEPALAPGAAFDVLQELRAAGSVRAVGLGVRSHAFHQRVIAEGLVDVVLTYGDYNLLSQTASEGVLAPAAAAGVGVYNGMAVMYGLLNGQDPRQVVSASRRPEADVRRARALWEFACSEGLDLLALALQFCLREPRIACTLVGCASPEEVAADVRAAREGVAAGVWERMGDV